MAISIHFNSPDIVMPQSFCKTLSGILFFRHFFLEKKKMSRQKMPCFDQKKDPKTHFNLLSSDTTFFLVLKVFVQPVLKYLKLFIPPLPLFCYRRH